MIAAMTEPLEFEVFTIFPAAIRAFVDTGLLGKALVKGHLRVHCTDYREFCFDRHRTVDDAPFGGGAGMVLRAEPVVAALAAATLARGPMHRILLTPSGARFDQRVAERLATLPRIGLLCGRYEGIDDRVREGWVDECLSIGDFVLNGGEVAAATIIEAVARLREGVLGNPESIEHESFSASASSSGWDPGLVVEHPHYTRPASLELAGDRLDVPELLLRGDHAEVEAWRRRMACLRTWMVRPDLRRPWTLPAEHPLILIAPSDRAELLAAALGHARALGLTCTGIQVGGEARRGMRDLKQALRSLRKTHRDAPWVLGVGAAISDQAERSPAMVLDVLAYARRRLPGPLVLWLGSCEDPQREQVDAWLALNDASAAVSPDDLSRLAIARRLIDISQPLSAGSPSLPHVRVALERLRTMIDPSTGSGERETSP
ncbi:tRNA (guanosine(37)-N1)-methyltransferase TrmD [Nannocystaceae bacterium ST9]